MDNCRFDINPSQVGGTKGIEPGQIVLFTCQFLCDASEKPSMKISDIGAICELHGGPVYEYKISAQISNLSVDVQPSHVNFAEVPFCQECQQTFTVTNVSDVATTI